MHAVTKVQKPYCFAKRAISLEASKPCAMGSTGGQLETVRRSLVLAVDNCWHGLSCHELFYNWFILVQRHPPLSCHSLVPASIGQLV